MRFIDLDGCFNFRDLGGYPTRDGRVIRRGEIYRSDALHLLTSGDVARLRHELRVGHVVDLRSTAELQSEGRGPLAREPMQFHHLPLYDGQVRGQDRADIDLAERYCLLAEIAMTPIARVLQTLASTDAPAVFHCAAGKDRTGVVAAVLLGIVDVEDDVIVADYVLTQANLATIIERLAGSDGYRVALQALPADTLHAQPQTMSRFLEKMRAKYGPMRAYARAAGVTDDTVRQLETRLLGG